MLKFKYLFTNPQRICEGIFLQHNWALFITFVKYFDCIDKALFVRYCAIPCAPSGWIFPGVTHVIWCCVMYCRPWKSVPYQFGTLHKFYCCCCCSTCWFNLIIVIFAPLLFLQDNESKIAFLQKAIDVVGKW